MINKHVQKFLVDKTNIVNYFMKNGLMYYNGLIIECKKYYKHKDFILNVNLNMQLKVMEILSSMKKTQCNKKNHRKK